MNNYLKRLQIFERKFDKLPSGCWEWKAAILPTGYGSFSIGNKRSITAHRFSYTVYNGPITKGMHVHHTCCNRVCVNPEHLKLVTPLEHRQLEPRGWRKKKSNEDTCNHGHLRSKYMRVDKSGRKYCHQCNYERTKERRARLYPHRTKLLQPKLGEIETAEVCQLLSISRQRLHQIIKSGRLKAEHRGRRWYFDKADIERFSELDRPAGIRLPRKHGPLQNRRKTASYCRRKNGVNYNHACVLAGCHDRA